MFTAGPTQLPRNHQSGVSSLSCSRSVLSNYPSKCSGSAHSARFSSRLPFSQLSHSRQQPLIQPPQAAVFLMPSPRTNAARFSTATFTPSSLKRISPKPSSTMSPHSISSTIPSSPMALRLLLRFLGLSGKVKT